MILDSTLEPGMIRSLDWQQVVEVMEAKLSGEISWVDVWILPGAGH
jgi:hypothetical protein